MSAFSLSDLLPVLERTLEHTDKLLNTVSTLLSSPTTKLKVDRIEEWKTLQNDIITASAVANSLPQINLDQQFVSGWVWKQFMSLPGQAVSYLHNSASKEEEDWLTAFRKDLAEIIPIAKKISLE